MIDCNCFFFWLYTDLLLFATHAKLVSSTIIIIIIIIIIIAEL